MVLASEHLCPRMAHLTWRKLPTSVRTTWEKLSWGSKGLGSCVVSQNQGQRSQRDWSSQTFQMYQMGNCPLGHWMESQ